MIKPKLDEILTVFDGWGDIEEVKVVNIFNKRFEVENKKGKRWRTDGRNMSKKNDR